MQGARQEAPDAPAPVALLVRDQRSRRRSPSWPLYLAARAGLEPAIRLWWRPDVRGRHHLPSRGPLIVVANHRLAIDPIVIYGGFPRPIHVLAKAELFRRPRWAWVLCRLGAIPVHRDGDQQRALGAAEAALREGGIVLVLPEGTRVRGPALGAPRTGAARLALATGAPIVPVALRGGRRRGGRLLPERLRIACGPPIPAPAGRASSPTAVTAHTASAWAAVDALWRSLAR